MCKVGKDFFIKKNFLKVFIFEVWLWDLGFCICYVKISYLILMSNRNC